MLKGKLLALHDKNEKLSELARTELEQKIAMKRELDLLDDVEYLKGEEYKSEILQ